jgi:hypothetical protein
MVGALAGLAGPVHQRRAQRSGGNASITQYQGKIGACNGRPAALATRSTRPAVKLSIE